MLRCPAVHRRTVPSNKRTRIQAYLDPELAELVRQRAEEEERPESREVTRLVRLGLEADAKQYVLGGKVFRTKADVQAHVRHVRDITPLGNPVRDEAVLALLKLHPEWEVKTAGGGWVGTAWIHHPSKARPTKELSICFSNSDKVVDISWTKLIPLLQRGIEPAAVERDDTLDELRAAARGEIEQQIAPLRKPGYEVHHDLSCRFDQLFYGSFDQILYDWLVSVSLRPADVVIVWEEGAHTGRRFGDLKQAASWRAFHADRAQLRTVTKQEHAAMPRAPRTPWDSLLC